MEAVTWIGVALSGIAMIGTALNARSQRLGMRDQLQHSARLVELETQARADKTALVECEKRHEQAALELAALRQTIERLIRHTMREGEA